MKPLLADFFANDGPLSWEIPGYASRSGQLEMTEAVDEAIDSIEGGARLLVEAPCGVGKSVAVLAPILIAGKKAILATANNALAEQYVQKDFGLVARALGSSATVALAKGMNNYVCLHKLDELDDSNEELDRVIRWADRTKIGDLSELDFVPGPRSLPLVTTSADECLKRACPRHSECFALKARAAVQKADVVVTNYHLLFAHLEVSNESSTGDGILPAADVLVLDEVHHAAEIARNFVGARVTEWAVRRALAPLAPTQASRHARPALDVGLSRRAINALQGVFSRAALLKPGRIKKRGLLGADELARDLDAAAEVYCATISEAVGESFEPAKLFGAWLPKELQKWYRDRTSPDEKRLVAWLERLRISGRSLRKHARLLECADGLFDDEKIVYFTERAGQRSTAVCSAPIEVRDYLEERVWENYDQFPAVVGMSATLRDGAESFELVVAENGAESARTLAVESPFDFSRCMLVCDSDWPEPKDPKFAAHLERTLQQTIDIAGGRTLGLFASHRALDAAYAAISSQGYCLAREGGYERVGNPLDPVDQNISVRRVRIWKQGDAPRTELVRRFKEDERSVLLGTSSFWEGVDVPGRALSALFIEKLPFATPDDPIFSALDEKLGKEAFSKYSVPKAVLAFRQGFGRLIRAISDAGIVVCADPRLFRSSYGHRFTSVLPEGCVAGSFGDAKEHLREFLGT